MDTKRNIPHPASGIQHPRRAFTLVELLVVITIIAILSALLMVGVSAARRAAFRARISADMNQVASGFEEYKNKMAAYPPNCQTDFGPDEALPTPAKQQIYNDLKRHLSQAFPLHREPDTLIQYIAGVGNPQSGEQQLLGGMRAGEAVVFWLGGFSSDPKYPISGEGGPSFLNDGNTPDPIENRNWILDVDTTRLGPRAADGYFDSNVDGGRFVVYSVTINGTTMERRINFWQYGPRGSEQPYLYFDTSRYTPDIFDPPASAGLHVHALKRMTNNVPVFATPDKFQIIHCGIDGEWGEEFDRTSMAAYIADPTTFLAVPTGPFTGDMADTQVNFITESTLEDAQP
jgi:prepilin-type N-terminal cleavage/methylation domain-containing protein